MEARMIESMPEGTGVVRVGAASFLMPWLEFRGSPSQLARLQVAAMLEPANDLAGAVQGLLDGIEAEMFKEARRRAKIPEGRAIHVPRHLYAEEGPVHLVPARDLGLPAFETVDGRVYAPDPFRSTSALVVADPEGISEDLAQAPAEISYRSLTENQVNRRAMAELYLQRAEETGDHDAAQAARRILLRMHKEIVQDTEAKSLGESRHVPDAPLRLWRRKTIATRRAILEAKGLQQKVVLAAVWRLRCSLRTVEIADWIDAPSRRSDDGLKNLFDNEHLTLVEYIEGLAYRRLYIATERSLRSAINFDRVGAREDNRDVKDWGAAQIKRKQIEALVLNHFGRNGRGITTLRLVGGEGRTINAISRPSSGSDRIQNRKALKIALELLVVRRALDR